MSTDTILFDVNFRPGIDRESTEYASKGGWYNGDKVRFRAGKPENIRGYEKRVQKEFLGTGRSAHPFASNDGVKYHSFGTPHHLYLYSGGVNADITPIRSSITSTVTYSTQASNTRILVSAASHGARVGDYFILVSSATVGGNHRFINSQFEVVSAATNSFTFNTTIASSATTTISTRSKFQFYIHSGGSVNIPELGWGVGVYNAGVSVSGARTWSRPANVNPTESTEPLRQWSLDNFGEDLLAVPRGGRLYVWDESSGTGTRSVVVPTAPSTTNFMFVSQQDRHVICLGTNGLDGVFDPMLARWSDQNDYTNWSVNVSSTSGENQLGDGSKLITGLNTRNQSLLWTDNALHGMEFVGPPFIFQFRQLGSNCGIVGQHAAVELDGRVFWMGNKDFFVYDGAVNSLPCTVRRFVFDDFNFDQKEKTFVGTNQEFREVTWLYPSKNSSECDRYVTYNPIENYWTFGSTIFTTWKDKSIFTNIITTGKEDDGDNYLYTNEPEGIYTADGQAQEAFLESSEFDTTPPAYGPGDNIIFLDRIVPDFTINDSGRVTLKIKTKNFPNGTAREKGPFFVRPDTQFIRTRARGRQATIRISTSTGGTNWRLGSFRMDVMQDGKR
tara:strand:+ start:638 stop:2482 length:1845 start_codon:yes stop_codon:yes gene_type:complete